MPPQVGVRLRRASGRASPRTGPVSLRTRPAAPSGTSPRHQSMRPAIGRSAVGGQDASCVDPSSPRAATGVWTGGGAAVRVGDARRMGRRALHELGNDHHGVVTPACAVRVGVAPSTLRSWARAEGWPQPYPHTWVLPGHDLDLRTRAVAAVRSVGGAAVLTGHSGLALHGLLPTTPTTIELSVPRSHRRIVLDDVRTCFTRVPVEPVDAGLGAPVAPVARCLADALGMGDDHALAVALDAIGRRSLVRGDLLAEVAGRRRFPGRPRLRRLVAALDADGSESGFEHRTRARLIAAGLRPDPDQLTVVTRSGTRRIDVPFGDHGTGVERVGFAYHGSREQFDTGPDRRDASCDRAVIPSASRTHRARAGPAADASCGSARVRRTAGRIGGGGGRVRGRRGAGRRATRRGRAGRLRPRRRGRARGTPLT